MSVEALAVVLHHLPVGGTTKLVALGIANHAGDGGSFPSVSTLAKYACVTDRTVQRAVRELEEGGWVKVHINDGGTHKTAPHERPNLYELLLKCPPECDGSTNHRVAKDPVTQVSPPDADVTPPVTPVSPPPVTPTSPPPVTQVSPEPSLEPSNEPSNNRGGVPVSPEGVLQLRKPDGRPRIWQPSERALANAHATVKMLDIPIHITRYVTVKAERGGEPTSAEWLRWILKDEQEALTEHRRKDAEERKKRGPYNVAE